MGDRKCSASTSEIQKNEGYWTTFLRSVKVRGLDGGTLVMSDPHSGLKKAIGTVLRGAARHRCWVFIMRNVLSIVPKGSQGIVTLIICTIFAGPTVSTSRKVRRGHQPACEVPSEGRHDTRRRQTRPAYLCLFSATVLAADLVD